MPHRFRPYLFRALRAGLPWLTEPLSVDALLTGLESFQKRKLGNADVGVRSARLLLATIAKSTLANYVRFYNLWLAFASTRGFPVTSTDEVHLLHFVSHGLDQKGWSANHLASVLDGTRWVLALVDIPWDWRLKSVLALLKGSRKMLPKPIERGAIVPHQWLPAILKDLSPTW